MLGNDGRVSVKLFALGCVVGENGHRKKIFCNFSNFDELPTKVNLDALEIQNLFFLMEFNMQKFKFDVHPPLWRIFLQDFNFCSSIEKLWNFSRQLLLCSCVAQNWKSYKVFSM